MISNEILEAMADHAHDLIGSGRYADAVVLMIPYASPKNNNPYFYNELGSAFGQLGTRHKCRDFWKAAYEYHNTAYKIYPDLPLYCFNLAMAASHLGRHKEALELMKKYVDYPDVLQVQLAYDIIDDQKKILNHGYTQKPADNPVPTFLPTIRTPYWFGLAAGVFLVLAVVFSWWWLVLAGPATLQAGISWRFYFGAPWLRLYFPLKRSLTMEFGFEKGICESLGKELDRLVPVKRVISRARPAWTTDEIDQFVHNEMQKVADFEDESLLRKEAMRLNPKLEHNVLERFIEEQREIFADIDPGAIQHIFMAGLIEEDLGSEQRGRFLFKAVTGKLK